MRNKPLPKIRVPVLYIELAMEVFERELQQEPEYDNEVVDGYISAEIYWNRRDTWETLRALRDRGVVWLPNEKG